MIFSYKYLVIGSPGNDILRSLRDLPHQPSVRNSASHSFRKVLFPDKDAMIAKAKALLANGRPPYYPVA